MDRADLLTAIAPALALASVACEVTPVSGSGAYASRVVVRPVKEEVAEFPELRALLGAERPAWMLNFAQADVVGRPMPGDRVTVGAKVYQLRQPAQSDRLALRWFCSGFVVEDEAGDALEPAIYMPAGLGFATAGSLLA